MLTVELTDREAQLLRNVVAGDLMALVSLLRKFHEADRKAALAKVPNYVRGMDQTVDALDRIMRKLYQPDDGDAYDEVE